MPIVRAFVSKAGVDIEIKDISLAARVLSAFSDFLDEHGRVDDALAELGDLVKFREANIIKLPNISASIPQLKAVIQELRSKGFNVPFYPDFPLNDKEKDIQARYNKVKGSAVNPVLREGNSDRRAPKAVKNYAKTNPHSMGDWASDSRTHVSTMEEGDFFHNEKSLCLEKSTDVIVKLYSDDGSFLILKDSISLLSKEIIDVSVMRKRSLISFLEREIKAAKDLDILVSFHMKATMMKVSDPIIFSHVVSVFFKDLIQKHSSTFNELGVDFKNGFGDLIAKLNELSSEKEKKLRKILNWHLKIIQI